jgi:hypothetical protein
MQQMCNSLSLKRGKPQSPRSQNRELGHLKIMG